MAAAMDKILFAMALLFGLFACGQPTEEGTEPTLSGLQENIFSPRCSNAACHGGDNPVRELNLSDGNAFASLVDVESTTGQIYVIPSDPENSLLYQIIQESVGDIRQMPPGFTVEDDDVALVKAWIEAGAANN